MDKPTYPKEGTQGRIILEALISAPGQPVGVNILMRIAKCAAVHSSVATLRSKRGWDIRNQLIWETNESGQRIRHSEYHIPLAWLERIQRDAA